MAIVGGAIVPVLGGMAADAASIAVALAVPAACYAVIAVFGWSARKPGVAVTQDLPGEPSIL
jgi:FHS family L-fucose permease-like MFS transporter